LVLYKSLKIAGLVVSLVVLYLTLKELL